MSAFKLEADSIDDVLETFEGKFGNIPKGRREYYRAEVHKAA